MDDLKTHLNQESESNWIHGGNSAINDSKDAEKHHPLIISKSSKENIDPEDGQPAGGKKKEKNQKEKYRLGGKKPLQTLLILLVGPLVSQVVNGLYGVVSSMWVARALGDIGMSAISLYSNLDMIGRAFGFFLLSAASQKISGLFGENKGDEAGQLICDLFRMAFVFGIIVPAILVPSSVPLAHWFGANETTISMAFRYLTPLNCAAFNTCIYLMWCGCLQAEGRSILVGIVQISSLVANMAIFCPLFLLVFKWGTIGAAFATIVAEFIPSVILTFLFFNGKFGVKPNWRGLFRKFSPHTGEALKTGLSQLIMNISRSIPSIFNRKFMGLCAENRNMDGSDGTFDDAIAGFNAVSRIYGVTDAVRLAVSMGLLPSASFAYSSHRYNRIFVLMFHAIWIDAVWSAATTLLTAFGSRYVAMSISTSENYLRWAAPMLRIANWEAPFAWIRNIVQTILQSLTYGTTSTVYSFFSTFCTYIGGLLLLYYTNKKDFVRLMYVFPISSSIAAVIGIIVVFFPLRKIWKQRRDTDDLLEPPPTEESKDEKLSGTSDVHSLSASNMNGINDVHDEDEINESSIEMQDIDRKDEINNDPTNN